MLISAVMGTVLAVVMNEKRAFCASVKVVVVGLYGTVCEVAGGKAEAVVGRHGPW